MSSPLLSLIHTDLVWEAEVPDCSVMEVNTAASLNLGLEMTVSMCLPRDKLLWAESRDRRQGHGETRCRGHRWSSLGRDTLQPSHHHSLRKAFKKNVTNVKHLKSFNIILKICRTSDIFIFFEPSLMLTHSRMILANHHQWCTRLVQPKRTRSCPWMTS